MTSKIWQRRWQMDTITLHDLECVPLLERARKRFMEKVGPPNEKGCTEWLGKIEARGYGTICVKPISVYLKAHRMSWVLATRQPIPLDAPVVRHKCDNPRCVNPSHLEIGQQSDNCDDTLIRGRAKGGAWERHRKAKLSREQVEEIRRRRAQGESCAQLGREFGVGRDQVSRICTGKVWQPHSIRHLDQGSAG